MICVDMSGNCVIVNCVVNGRLEVLDRKGEDSDFAVFSFHPFPVRNPKNLAGKVSKISDGIYYNFEKGGNTEW